MYFTTKGNDSAFSKLNISFTHIRISGWDGKHAGVRYYLAIYSSEGYVQSRTGNTRKIRNIKNEGSVKHEDIFVDPASC